MHRLSGYDVLQEGLLCIPCIGGPRNGRQLFREEITAYHCSIAGYRYYLTRFVYANRRHPEGPLLSVKLWKGEDVTTQECLEVLLMLTSWRDAGPRLDLKKVSTFLRYGRRADQQAWRGRLAAWWEAHGARV